jgi:hypothetical protein
MSTELITKDNERIKSLFFSLDRLLDRIETVMTGYEPSLNGERFLTVTQVMEKLKISRRALQEYRSKGKIPYIQLGVKHCTGSRIFKSCWNRTIARRGSSNQF